MEDVTLVAIMAAIIYAGVYDYAQDAGYNSKQAASKAVEVLAAVNEILRNPHSSAASSGVLTER